MSPTKNELRAAAYHEAGHAVVALRYRRKVLEVTIASSDEVPACELDRVMDRFDLSCGEGIPASDIQILFAGGVAECMSSDSTYRHGVWDGSVPRDYYWDPDVDNEQEEIRFGQYLATHICYTAEEYTAFIIWLRVRTENILRLEWHAVEAVAGVLLERTTLTGQELQEVVTAAAALKALSPKGKMQ
jgi:hypothetical protein